MTKNNGRGMVPDGLDDEERAGFLEYLAAGADDSAAVDNVAADADDEVRRKRHEAAMRGVETKRLRTLEEAREAVKHIHVERVHKRNLLMIVLADQEDVYERDGKVPLDVWDAPEAIQERWAVNFIRHVLTDYNHELWKQKGRVGKQEAYVLYKSAVLDHIAKVYPYLRAECERQKERLLIGDVDD